MNDYYLFLIHVWSSDIVLAKIDFNGNQIWRKIFGGKGFNRVTDIAIDRHDNVYLTGSAAT